MRSEIIFSYKLDESGGKDIAENDSRTYIKIQKMIFFLQTLNIEAHDRGESIKRGSTIQNFHNLSAYALIPTCIALRKNSIIFCIPSTHTNESFMKVQVRIAERVRKREEKHTKGKFSVRKSFFAFRVQLENCRHTVQNEFQLESCVLWLLQFLCNFYCNFNHNQTNKRNKLVGPLN